MPAGVDAWVREDDETGGWRDAVPVPPPEVGV
jgi:hypothetical protein